MFRRRRLSVVILLVLSTPITYGRQARGLGEANGTDTFETDPNDIKPAEACDHCLKVDFYKLGLSCDCMFHCCRGFHYDVPNVDELPLACRHYYFDTQKWKQCTDPCDYCTKSEFLGFDGQRQCFESCCDTTPRQVLQLEVVLSYRLSESCADWQAAIKAQ